MKNKKDLIFSVFMLILSVILSINPLMKIINGKT